MKKLKLFYTSLVYISIILLILSTFITFLDNRTLNYFILRKSAEVGTYLLFLMLFAKSLYLILKHTKKSSSKFFTFLRNNNMYQREQGLIVFNIIFIHVLMTTIMFFSDINSLIFYYISAAIPTIVLLYMELTSFRFFQIRIKKWKKHHSLVWLVIPLIYVHVLLISAHTIRYLVLGGFIFLIVLIEKFIGLKRGTQHLVFLLIGFLLSTNQFFATQIYNNNKIANANQINESSNSNTEHDTEQSENTSIDEDTTPTNEDSIDTSSDTTDKEQSSETPYPEPPFDSEEHHGHGGDSFEKSSSSTSGSSTYTSSVETSEDGSTTYKDGTYTGQGYGHVGLIEVETTIENDQIISIDVIEENEDDPWWEPVISSLPDEVIANNSTDGIEYIAGSTHSSEGFLEAVDASLADAQA